jgi:ubiquinol-cytochrome c reductase iron-sulfur subunit
MRDRLRTILVLVVLHFLRRRLPRRAGGAVPAEEAPPHERERIVPVGTPQPRAELLAIGLLLFGALCAVAFVAVYVLDRLPRQTQLLGLSLGLALLAIASALIVTGKRLVVTEELEHDYPPEEHTEEQEAIVQTVAESGSRLTRRRLFTLGLAGAGGALAVAVLAPLASLGPGIDLDSFVRTPWRRGRRLVDEDGRPYRATDIEQDTFYTAFPEGADREQLASPLVVVRLPPRDLDLPSENAGFAARGIVAFSKICTHAGCAIALYRTPLFPEAEPKPALVCPCHYSTFDPATGGTVIFGPAGRKLPMLPLRIDARGYLRAAGNFDGPVGPSWWEVRARRPIA